MKKILLGIGLIFCGLTIQAQNNRPLSGGPKLGANIFSAWSDQQKTENVYGANIGLAGKCRFTKRQAIQVEAVYSTKGFIIANSNSTNKLSYIEIPVLYQRLFLSSKKGGHLAEKRRLGNIFLIAGPQVSIMMSSKVDFQNGENGAQSIDLYQNTRPFDMSAVAGIGYFFKNGLSIDARYVLGLRHLDAANQTAYVPTGISSVGYQFGVSYLMPFKFREATN